MKQLLALCGLCAMLLVGCNCAGNSDTYFKGINHVNIEVLNSENNTINSIAVSEEDVILLKDILSGSNIREDKGMVFAEGMYRIQLEYDDKVVYIYPYCGAASTIRIGDNGASYIKFNDDVKADFEAIVEKYIDIEGGIYDWNLFDEVPINTETISQETLTEEATTDEITTEETTTEQTTTQETTTQEPTTEEQTTTISNEQKLINTFVDLGDVELNNMCDDILVTILNVDMTDREKAYAIYTWVCDHVRYRGSSTITDWKEDAKGALATRKGNCYAFYVSSRALLARAGFETEQATSYTFDHYWNLVKVDGIWRHFDTTPGWGTERFLWTGTQIREYVYYNPELGRNITYEWNPEGCPDTD